MIFPELLNMFHERLSHFLDISTISSDSVEINPLIPNSEVCAVDALLVWLDRDSHVWRGCQRSAIIHVFRTIQIRSRLSRIVVNFVLWVRSLCFLNMMH